MASSSSRSASSIASLMRDGRNTHRSMRSPIATPAGKSGAHSISGKASSIGGSASGSPGSHGRKPTTRRSCPAFGPSGNQAHSPRFSFTPPITRSSSTATLAVEPGPAVVRQAHSSPPPSRLAMRQRRSPRVSAGGAVGTTITHPSCFNQKSSTVGAPWGEPVTTRTYGAPKASGGSDTRRSAARVRTTLALASEASVES